MESGDLSAFASQGPRLADAIGDDNALRFFRLDPFWWKPCFTKMDHQAWARHLGRQVRSFAASQAIRFRRKRTLDYPDVARTISFAFW